MIALDDHSAKLYPDCEGCPRTEASLEPLGAHLPEGVRAALDASVAVALARCARCLERSGQIDRAHIEDVMGVLGDACHPLGRFSEFARAARPDLPADAVLMIVEGASIWDPRVMLRERIERLVSLHAPEVVIAPLRDGLRKAERDPPFVAQWSAVHAWPPAIGTADRSLAHAAIAKVLARVVFARLELDEVVQPIERAADTARLGAADRALRDELDRVAQAQPRDRSAILARLAVRYLDELGHTDLRDDQDTLLDATYFALRAAGEPEPERVYRLWLEEAFVAAWRTIRP